MKTLHNWIRIVLLMIVGAAVGYLVATRTQSTQSAQTTVISGQVTTLATSDTAEPQTVQIQPAAAVMDEVQAAGQIELTAIHYVALGVDGVIKNVAVNVGDVVTAGQTLVTLDAIELERELRRAELAVQTQLTNQAQLTQAASVDELAAAQAELAAAEVELADLQAGPSDQEIAAARSSAASAWAKYNEIKAGASDAELTQLVADLKRKEVALAEAQRAYDNVAWRNDAGMTSQAADLQTATINYEEAKAAYAEMSAPASNSELQSALSSAQSAQQQLDDLLGQPNAADIESAQAKVATARSNLENLQNGADGLELQEAQLSLDSALLDLEEAYSNLDKTTVTAPLAGTVLEVEAKLGQRASRGAVVVSLADTRQLELTIDVADVDISQVSVGQPAAITIDAFPGQTFSGAVTYMAPASDSESGVVNYPVTIGLTVDNLGGVRPGMKAVATLLSTNANLTQDSWLVPTSALQKGGNGTTVTIMRNGQAITVAVTPGVIQGEWTVVQGPDLQQGDEVTAQLTSSVGEETGFGPGRGGPPPGGN
jgi:multidrug efflux pump subunit AcrA (membrane-fusion protein)